MNVLKPETAESIWPRGPTALARNRETGKDQRLLFFTKSLQTIGKRHRAWQRLLEDDLRMLWPSSRASSSLRMFKSATQCQGPSRGKDPRTRLFAYQLGIHVQDSHQSRTHVELRLLPAESTCGSPMQPCFSVLNIRKDETCGGTWTPGYKIGLLFQQSSVSQLRALAKKNSVALPSLSDLLPPINTNRPTLSHATCCMTEVKS